MLESQKGKVEEEVNELKTELGTINSTLQDLKAKLYGRFGKNINLEVRACCCAAAKAFQCLRCGLI